MMSRREFINSLRWAMYFAMGANTASLGQLALGQSSSGNEPIVPWQYQSGRDIRYTTEVGGFFRAIQLFKRFHRPGDEQDLRANCQRRQDALTTQFKFLEYYLANPDLANYPHTMQAHESLAQFLSYKGDMARAIEQFQAAYNLATEGQLGSGDLLRLQES